MEALTLCRDKRSECHQMPWQRAVALNCLRINLCWVGTHMFEVPWAKIRVYSSWCAEAKECKVMMTSKTLPFSKIIKNNMSFPPWLSRQYKHIIEILYNTKRQEGENQNHPWPQHSEINADILKYFFLVFYPPIYCNVSMHLFIHSFCDVLCPILS